MANLTRWEPMSEFTPLRQMMDRLFEDAWVRPWNLGGATSGWGQLAFDLYETDDDYVVTATLPGIKPDELELSIQGNMLTISGEHKGEEWEDKKRTYHVRERSAGRFSRQITLPNAVVGDRVQATMEHGVLTLHLPKVEEVKPRRIQVQAGTGSPQQISAPTIEHQAA